MSEKEIKMLAVIAMLVFKVLTNKNVDYNEMQSLSNIMNELGSWDLDEEEFRW